ncbi:MAG TPA: hypothetical protein VFD15_02670 [Clostridia bacterium]|nr:hypothetical protein [Clostridia bacterium]
MIYKNPFYRKVKGSFTLLICCGHCKTDIAVYQKVGKGGVLRMYIDRIVRSSIDLGKKPNALFCPNCNEQLATRVTMKRRNKEAYRMIRSAFNSRPG